MGGVQTPPPARRGLNTIWIWIWKSHDIHDITDIMAALHHMTSPLSPLIGCDVAALPLNICNKNGRWLSSARWKSGQACCTYAAGPRRTPPAVTSREEGVTVILLYNAARGWVLLPNLGARQRRVMGRGIGVRPCLAGPLGHVCGAWTRMWRSLELLHNKHVHLTKIALWKPSLA